MINHQAMEFLYLQFGTDPFKVRHLVDYDQVTYVMHVAGLDPSYTDEQSDRIRLGNALIETATGPLTFNIPPWGEFWLLALNHSDQVSGERATYCVMPMEALR